jgi:peptide/nickel transport system permease protein
VSRQRTEGGRRWGWPSSYLLSFTLRRLVGLVAVLLVVSIGVYALLDLAPGSPEQRLITPEAAPTPEALAAVRAQYHLDRPFIVRYGYWLENAVHLDLGRSVTSHEPVLQGIWSRLTGLTLPLAAFGLGLALLFGIPLGILAAFRQGGLVDRGIVGLAVVGFSSPAFITGIFLLVIFVRWLGWFPAFGSGSGFVDTLWHLTLPASSLAIALSAILIKQTRAATIATLENDHIVFAHARGLPRRRVFFRYVLRNSLVPIVTAGGLVLTFLLVGAILVEVTFGLPGVGSLLAESVASKDVTTVQGVAITFALAVVLLNFVIDLLYLAIDPRIRFGRGHA